ncbi:MAG: sensor histidine kinase [Methylococcaceae bacterium]|nr:MAG: sensor histidine kinase [Methylococcaceae bacterium]
MYSLLPAMTSTLFLGYGTYCLINRLGMRGNIVFIALCLATFLWQLTWAILFQATDPATILALVKFGCLLILFLPSALYQFLVEISELTSERRYVFFSYALAVVFAVFLLGSDWLIRGYYAYSWGNYPKAGPLHPLHMLQTLAVIVRGIHIAWRAQKTAAPNQRMRLQLCVVSAGFCLLSAIDYLGKYGIDFYPPGVIFITIGLGVMMAASYVLPDPMTLAAAIVHEIRTPLTIIDYQAMAIAKYWPTLFKGYQLAVERGIFQSHIRSGSLEIIANLHQGISREVGQLNLLIDMMLTTAAFEHTESMVLERHSVRRCLEQALQRYPFKTPALEKICISGVEDFQFEGSDVLLECALLNLLKNALYALSAANKGEIHIFTHKGDRHNSLHITDTGAGISDEILPHIFDYFYTTKRHGGGMGLPFCRRVMTAFGGQISCESRQGLYTTITLSFPVLI